MTGSRKDGHAALAAICGTTPNIGVTLISFAAAFRAAQAAGESVGYVCLNMRSSKLHRYLGIDHPPMTLDGWRAELRSGALDPERLRALSWRTDGSGWPPALHVLFGNQLREQGDYFTADEIRRLLGLVRQAFRFSIVEVNAYWDNAATLVAMEEADSRLLVTTPELGHFQEDGSRWMGAIAPLLPLPRGLFRLVVNRPHSPDDGGLSAADAAAELGMELAGEFPYTADAGRLLNAGRLLDLVARKSWREPAGAVAEAIGGQASASPRRSRLLSGLRWGRRIRNGADGS
ncbi:CpaE family protein [Paenibacillus thermoaerophilus]|uniref:CpaE family protein n=1 Tax=Paenibacillus thermoaerophilus TaxID=1215385 RepID=A0ABW2V7E1_9BACL|nr:hypothetical protein [Paenibacillus thermoaerophilus]TMV16116.1 hypothetical protein FE781_08575 [Paenibacillus thermoaerophilus]